MLEDQRATYYDGYWQDHRYLIDVKDDILREFVWRQPLTGKNAELFQQLASGNSVSIHYRGGDYVNHPTLAVSATSTITSEPSPKLRLVCDRAHLLPFQQ